MVHLKIKRTVLLVQVTNTTECPLELGTFSNDCCRASAATSDICIADIFQNAVFFLSGPGVDSDALIEEHVDRHSELKAKKCVGLSYRK